MVAPSSKDIGLFKQWDEFSRIWESIPQLAYLSLQDPIASSIYQNLLYTSDMLDPNDICGILLVSL